MKKLFIIAIAIMSMCYFTNVYAADVVASWEHDGQNVTGFIVFWKQSDQSAWQFNKRVDDGTARQMVLAPEEAFATGVEYSFVGVAYNSEGYSPDSDIATWTREGTPFTPPADKLPSVLYMTPNGINQIIISLP